MKNMTGLSNIMLVALAASALAGCGGGGGSSVVATQPAATFDLQTGIAGLVMNGQTANVTLSGTAVSGTSVPFTGTGTLTLASGVSATFNGEGTLSQTETISGTVTASGQSAPYSSSAVDYYATGNSAFVGETIPATGEYAVAQTAFTYPITVMAGSSGTLGVTSDYTDSTMSVAEGTTQVSYAVTAIAGSTSSVMVAVTDQVSDTQSNIVETEVTNYSLSDGGVLAWVSATVQNSSGSLTVTAQ
jgi:hypothetical protein